MKHNRTMQLFLLLFTALLAVFSLAGCQTNKSYDLRAVNTSQSSPYKDCIKTGTNTYECTMPDWNRRKFDFYVPNGLAKSFPAIIAIHGGGTNKEKAAKTTCTDGDLSSENCLSKYANSQGFAVIFPNGTGRFISPNVRTFNAGGGSQGWVCVSGYACGLGVNDTKYFSDLIHTMRTTLSINNNKIFVLGASNGAAMSHRLACEFPTEISGIAPVAGANQFETLSACSAKTAMPILAIHGDSDPCWPYGGGQQTCIPGETNNYVALNKSMENWRVRNGCSADTSSIAFSDLDPNDGTTASKMSYKNCRHTTSVITVFGGGHTWPLGLLHSKSAGKQSRDFSATKVIVDFFKSNL